MSKPGQPFTIACAFAIGMCGARAAGIAVLKEQAYHHDASASPVAYSRIIDSHGPYLRIVCGEKNIDIVRSKLAGWVDIPEGIPDSITEAGGLVPLRKTLAAINDFSARYPRSAPLLEKQAAALTADIKRFEAGEVRFEGAWISKEQHAGIVAARNAESESARRDADARERKEIEKWVFEKAQREKGLELHNGRWLPRQEIQAAPPEAPTELSDAVGPMWKGDLAGARFAVGNLAALASRQSGAPKVRTERLRVAIKNLFLAESRLSQRVLSNTAEASQAAHHERNAEKWLKPNAFGTVHTDASRSSREKAAEIRQRSAAALELCRQELLVQLRETDTLTADFHKLREHRVALILGGAVRAVSARHFTTAEFHPAFPDELLAAIRKGIREYEPGTAP